MANLRLRLHPAPVPAGAIGPATPVAPFQSLLSHVRVAAMLVSTAGPVTGTETRCKVCADGDREEEGKQRSRGERQTQRDGENRDVVGENRHTPKPTKKE